MPAFRLKFAVVIGLFAVLSPVEVAVSAPQQDDELARQVREAWKSRRDAIKTFHYECDLEERVTKAAKAGGTDVFGVVPIGEPTIDVELRSNFAFDYDKGKKAFKMDGQQWSEFRAVPKEYLLRATCDGMCKSLVQSGSRPHGSIRHSNPDCLTSFTHLTAFWLAFDPEEYLKGQGYEADKMRVDNQRVMRDGSECVELRMPRSNPQWEGLLCVDPKRAYVPVQFKQVKKGVDVTKLDIQYDTNDDIGWVVSAWVNQQLYPSGRPSSSAKATVKRSIINSDLDNAIFTLSFPAGCGVVEYLGQERKYYVQLEDGTLKEIPGDEYGRIGVE